MSIWVQLTINLRSKKLCNLHCLPIRDETLCSDHVDVENMNAVLLNIKSCSDYDDHSKCEGETRCSFYQSINCFLQLVNLYGKLRYINTSFLFL